MAHDDWLNQGNPMDQEELPLTDAELLTIKDRLIDIAAEVQENPHHWTKGVSARQMNFWPVPPDYEAAICWNVYGFLLRDFYELPKGDQMIQEAQKVLHAACGTDICSYNDGLLKPEQFVKWVLEAAETL